MSATPPLFQRGLLSVSQARRSVSHVKIVFGVTGCERDILQLSSSKHLHDSLGDNDRNDSGRSSQGSQF